MAGVGRLVALVGVTPSPDAIRGALLVVRSARGLHPGYVLRLRRGVTLHGHLGGMGIAALNPPYDYDLLPALFAPSLLLFRRQEGPGNKAALFLALGHFHGFYL